MIIKNISARTLELRDGAGTVYPIPAYNDIALSDALWTDTTFRRWMRYRIRDLSVATVVTGVDPKESVRSATTVNVTLSGIQTVDGVALQEGDRILVKNQTDATQNGIYQVETDAWIRTIDASDGTLLNSGAFTFVEEGTANVNTGWILHVSNPVVIGVTPLDWVKFTGSATVAAGQGLSESGDTLDVNVDGISLEVQADALQIKKSYLPYYNVKDYGAVGNGTTDDTQAIQNAIEAAHAVGGGIIILPAVPSGSPGYRVKPSTVGGLRFYDNIEFHCDGHAAPIVALSTDFAITHSIGSQTLPVGTFAVTSVANFASSGQFLANTNDTDTSTVIRVTYTGKDTIANTFTGCTITGGGGTIPDGAVIRQSQYLISNADRTNGNNNIRITNLYIQGPGSLGITDTGGSDEVDSTLLVTRAIDIASATDGTHHCDKIRLDFVTIDNWPGPNVYLTNWRYFACNNNRLTNTLRGGFIALGDASYGVIFGNVIDAGRDDCIALNGVTGTGAIPYAPHHVSVTTNVTREATDAEYAGIKNNSFSVNGAQYCTISMNVLQNAGGSASIGKANINLNSFSTIGCSYINVTNNVCLNSGYYGIDYQARVAAKVVKISQNLVSGSTKSGIRVAVSDNAGSITDLTISDNTLDTCGADDSSYGIELLRTTIAGTLTGVYLQRNTIDSPGGSAIRMFLGSGGGATVVSLVLTDNVIRNPHRTGVAATDAIALNNNITGGLIARNTFFNDAANVCRFAINVTGTLTNCRCIDTIGRSSDFTSGLLGGAAITANRDALPDAATVTINSDYNFGMIAELSQNTTLANPTGTPQAFQSYLLRVKTGTTRAITWGTQFRGSTDLPLPSPFNTTGSGKWDYLTFRWNNQDTKWDLMSIVKGF